jgi:hypothetical protein
MMKKSKCSRSPGRKLKLTRGLIREICTLIKNGNFAEVACSACGIGKTTFYRWLQLGEEDRAGIYREFRDALEVASAKAEVAAIETLLAQKSPDQIKWFLERRYSGRWARKEPRGQALDTEKEKAIGVMIMCAEDVDKEREMLDFPIRDATPLDYPSGTSDNTGDHEVD